MSAISNIYDWVIAVKQGDSHAWDNLYQQFYPGIYAIALKYTNQPEDAADVVQEAFITAFLKIQHLREPAAFAGWIKKIVINHCLRKSQQDRKKMDMNTGIIADTLLSIENFSESVYDQERLYTILAELPESLRATTMLRYFSTYNSYEEIANILSVPVGTVRSRLNQAKSKLTSQWKNTSPQASGKKEWEWNNFYEEAFSRMHVNDCTRNRFLNHLAKDVQLQLHRKEQVTGRSSFERMIISDRKYGSQLYPINIYSSGNLSIVESKHINSSEHPNHCPNRSVLLLYRNEKQVHKMSFHVSC